MSRKVENKREAYLKEDVMEKLLDENNWTYDDLLGKLKDKYEIDIGYKQLARLMKNTTNWKLTYAFILCDYFNLKIEELFQLEDKRC